MYSCVCVLLFFFFKQKTADELRISDWSSDVCSSDLLHVFQRTPSTIDVRDQRATSEAEIEQWSREPGWAKARRERLATISSGRTALQGNDDFLSGRDEAVKPKRTYARELTPEEPIPATLNSTSQIGRSAGGDRLGR